MQNSSLINFRHFMKIWEFFKMPLCQKTSEITLSHAVDDNYPGNDGGGEL